VSFFILLRPKVVSDSCDWLAFSPFLPALLSLILSIPMPDGLVSTYPYRFELSFPLSLRPCFVPSAVHSSFFFSSLNDKPTCAPLSFLNFSMCCVAPLKATVRPSPAATGEAFGLFFRSLMRSYFYIWRKWPSFSARRFFVLLIFFSVKAWVLLLSSAFSRERFGVFFHYHIADLEEGKSFRPATVQCSFSTRPLPFFPPLDLLLPFLVFVSFTESVLQEFSSLFFVSSTITTISLW